MLYAVGNIYNTTIDNNQASHAGGGMYISHSDVTMKNTIISNNKATDSGSGLYITGDSTVILRQSSFINNDAFKGSVIVKPAPELSAKILSFTTAW